MSAFIYSYEHSHYIPDPALKPADFKSSAFLIPDEQEHTEYPLETHEKLICTVHPKYKGLRLGAMAKQCHTCTKIYEAVKASGFKEKRG